MRGNEHSYRFSTYHIYNRIVYQNENHSVNFCSNRRIQKLALAYGNGCACGFSDKLALLVSNDHLGDTSPFATLHHPALGSDFIISPGTVNEMDIELGGETGEG